MTLEYCRDVVPAVSMGSLPRSQCWIGRHRYLDAVEMVLD